MAKTRYDDAVELLEVVLRHTANAHHEYEKTLRTSDEDWPAWYAKHIAENYPITLSNVAQVLYGVAIAKEA